MLDNNSVDDLCETCGRSHVELGVCPVRGKSPSRIRGYSQPYTNAHVWVKRNLTKTGKCAHCGKKTRTHWANIDHQYRLDATEWIEYCPKCHDTFDRLMNGKRTGFAPMPEEERLRRWRNSLKSYREALPRLRTYAWFSE